MPSTFTSALRFTKQGIGENASTWGGLANTDRDLIEQSVAGTLIENTTGSGDITLTATNGALDESRNMVLNFTGTPSAARNVIIPGVSKIYVVKADHTAETLTLKTSGGTGVDFTQGESAIVYCDGTDVIKISDLVSTNNLSDLSNASAARDNLGLQPTSPLETSGTSLEINVSALEDDLGLVPIGGIQMYGASAAPSKWLLCQGSAVSRTTYSDLFGVIGVVYGSGDGSTTFNLPNFSGRMPIGMGQGNTAEGGGSGTLRSLNDTGGAEEQTLTSGEIPELTGTVDGATEFGAGPGQSLGSTGTGSGTIGVTVNSGSPTAVDIMNPFLGINFIIFSGV
jgi:microcystin-dependent protein